MIGQVADVNLARFELGAVFPVGVRDLYLSTYGFSPVSLATHHLDGCMWYLKWCGQNLWSWSEATQPS